MARTNVAYIYSKGLGVDWRIAMPVSESNVRSTFYHLPVLLQLQ